MRASASSRFALTPVALVARALIAALAAPLAMAAPEGGQVVAGSAAITQSGVLTTVQQTSQRAAIDWRAFNVGANETVNFVQPNAQSAVLNRVVGNDASAIFGRITANGQVFLVNPNGVLFGRTAQVDVGGLVASTANLSNADFMAGRLDFNQPGRAGATVVNEGQITVGEGGFAALIGKGVENRGVINARLGKVSLAAGDAFVLDLYGDRLVNLVVDPAAMQQLTDANGASLAAHVNHSGLITAEGGVVQLTAGTVQRLLDNVINVSGVVRATGFDLTAGRISLRGDDNTQVTLSAALDAGATGRIELNSGDVTLSAGNPATEQLMGVTPHITPVFAADLQIGNTTSGSTAVASDVIRQQLLRGSSVSLSASDNLTIDTEINGLSASGGLAGGGLTLTAGNNLSVNRSIVLNNGALNLTATSGTLTAAEGAVLYTGTGAVNLRGGAGVNVGQIASSGAVDVRSASGAVTLRNAVLAAGTSPTPASSLNVQATGNIALNGALTTGAITVNSSAGGVSLNSAVLQSTTGAVTVQAAQGITSVGTGVGLVAATNASATAGQAINIATALANGNVQLQSGGATTVAQAITNTTGGAATAVTIQSGGAVTLAGARAGGITVSSTGDTTSTAALVSTGAINVSASAGRVGTSATRLNVDANSITLSGSQGVNAASLLSPGAITLSASAGSVDVSQAISGAAGTVSVSTTARPSSVSINARDGVTLSGAAVGTGGLSITSQGNVALNTASVFSTGAVDVSPTGALTLADGVAVETTGDTSTVRLRSTGSTLTVGTGGVRANGNAAITLEAQNNLALNGDVQTQAGLITVTSATGAVAAQVAAGSTPVAGDAVIDAGQDATASRITVTGAGQVLLGEMRAAADITARSTGGNVLLRRGLGGTSATTGYANFAQGYQDALRPNVGRLIVEAPTGSVELNGLNLDGNRLPTDTTPGLTVTAGRMIVSNDAIAVNKGDIVLTAGTTQATDGIYLGNNVYSRGWDSVGADGTRGTADDRKLAYGIRITGRTLGLFDNTQEIANLPSNTSLVMTNVGRVRVDRQGYLVDDRGVRLSPPQVASFDFEGESSTSTTVYRVDGNGLIIGNPALNGTAPSRIRGATSDTRDVAKVIVSNNSANYLDQPDRLVPATTAPTTPSLLLAVQDIAGVGNHNPAQGRIDVSSFAPSLVALSEAPVSVQPRAGVVASPTGIGLKLLGFESAGDTTPLLWGQLGGGLVWSSQPLADALDVQVTNTVRSGNVLELDVLFNNSDNYVRREVVYNGTLYEQVGVGVIHTFTLTWDGFGLRATPVGLRVPPYSFINVGGNTPPEALAQLALLPWDNQPWMPTDVSVRLYGEVLVATPGSAQQVQINAALHPVAGVTPTALQTGSVLNSQVAQLNGVAIATGNQSFPARSETDYLLTRATVSTTAGQTTSDTRGTRVFVFDGAIDGLSRAVFDIAGGQVVPGGVGAAGSNNSGAGFAGVGTSFTPVGGTATGVAVGTPASTGVGAVGAPSAGAGGITVVGDRTLADVPTQEQGDAPQAFAGSTLLYGQRPAALADLGRSGGVQGSAVNVLRKRFPLATSSNSAVCADADAAPNTSGSRNCAP